MGPPVTQVVTVSKQEQGVTGSDTMNYVGI